jgi:DNA invertase Pin-like site-specific DNA recombinase
MVGYLRVSTEEQAQLGYGLDAQEIELERAAEFHRWQLVELVRDEGASGKDLDRPGLKHALQLIADGHADGIAIAKLDRLSRSVVDFGALLEWLEEAGATLAALDLNVDTGTPAGRMVAHVLMAVAEWERRTIAARTKAGLAAKRAKGESTGRPAVADEPGLVERIREMRASGMSLQAIADRLNAEDVPTMRGAERWRASSVQTAAGWRRRPPRRRHPALPPLQRRRRAA